MQKDTRVRNPLIPWRKVPTWRDGVRGFDKIPVQPGWSNPALTLKEYRHWWRGWADIHPRTGFMENVYLGAPNPGLRCDGLTVLDADDAHTVCWIQQQIDAGTIPATPCVDASRRGQHYFYAGESRRGGLRPGNNPHGLSLDIKTGCGSWVGVPPADPYAWLDQPLPDVWDELPPTPAEFIESLFPGSVEHPPRPPRPANGRRPGDLWNADGDVEAVLERNAWTLGRESGEQQYWCRPGKDKGTSATFHTELRTFYVFSSAAPPFEADEAYSPLAVLALLEYDGDFSAACRYLAPQMPKRWRHPTRLRVASPGRTSGRDRT